MLSRFTLTYLEITSISSCCSAGRKSAAAEAPLRSWAMISCRRSLATAAVFGFWPNSNVSRDMSLSSEQALEQARLLVIDEAQRQAFAEEAADHVGVGLGDVAAVHVDGRRALIGGLQDDFRFRHDAEQRHPQQFLDVL